MASITINPTDNILHTFTNQIAAIGEGKARVALARAVNRVTTTVDGRVVRALVKQTSAPRKIVRAQVKKYLTTTALGSSGAIEGRVVATGRPIALKHFKPKQNSKGTAVTIYGKRETIAGAFMGARPGMLTSKFHGHVFKRRGIKRLKIDKQLGPSIPPELVKGESLRIFEQTVATMLPERVRHELGRMLP